MRRPVGFASIVCLLVCALGAPASVGATGFDFLYPSDDTSCTSSDSLQDCVNAALAGGKVEIDTNTPINLGGALTLATSFTLTSAAGFHADLVGAVNVWPASSPVAVTVSNLQIDGLLTFLATQGSGGHTIVFDRVRVVGADLMGGAIDVNTHVPANVTVERSTASVRGKDYGPAGIQLYADTTGGLVTFRAIGNTLTGHGSTGTSSGIRIFRHGGGTLYADIDNNAVWDVGQGGGGSALSTYVDGTGNSLINVAGNTFDRSAGYGILLSSSLGGGGMVFNVFDTAVSHATAHGVSIVRTPGSRNFVVAGGSNDFYANGPNTVTGYDLGSSLSLAPAYTNEPAGDLTLKASSPLIDQGLVCSPAGVAITDAAGMNRLAGKSVDIGAYEFGAPAVNGVAVAGTAGQDIITGTAGNDILCGFGDDDTIRGQGGADYINGGAGRDLISGGPGADRLFGGPDADIICAADGTADLVNGGTGTDRSIADAHDTLISIEVKQSQCPFSQ